MIQNDQVLTGIPAAPGLAHGKTILVKQKELEVPNFKSENVDAEIKRIHAARNKAKIEIIDLMESVGERAKQNEADIFGAHNMILDDVTLLEKAEVDIKRGINAEKAWMDAIEYFAQMMEQIPDETLSSRAVDIRDVGRRVLGHLLGVEIGGLQLKEPSVIIGEDLTPSDTASLDKDLVLAFCTAEGGPTSHTAILAKAFGLPAIVGLGKEVLSIPDGTLVIVNGDLGKMQVNPSEEELVHFIKQEKAASEELEIARKAAQAPAMTADGDYVEVVANVGGIADAPLGIKNGAEGVGLFRTEFRYHPKTAQIRFRFALHKDANR